MTSASVKLLRTQSDERLVQLAAAGHERAFEAIVERYRRPLLRHCRRYLPDARAEDALQQALVSAWSALRRGDDIRDLRPWLHRIVHNTSLNALRAAGYDYEQLRDTLQGDGGPAELVERSAVVRQALAGLAALPERQREALLQIAVEGRSQDEVAEELGLSHGAVRQLVHRARRSLRGAATALTPLPMASWLAGGGDGGERGDVVARVAELVAGAGGSATLAKAGAVAALAGGAVGAPVVMDRVSERPSEPPSAAAAAPRAAADRPQEPAATAAPVPVADSAQDPETAQPAARRDESSGDSGGEGSGRGEDAGERREDDRSGPGGGGDDGGRGGGEFGGGAGDDDRDDDVDRSGPGGGGGERVDDDRGGGRGRGGDSDDDDDDDRSGPGGGTAPDDDEEPDDDDSGGDDRSVPLRLDDPVDTDDDDSGKGGGSGQPVPAEPLDSSGPGGGAESASEPVAAGDSDSDD